MLSYCKTWVVALALGSAACLGGSDPDDDGPPSTDLDNEQATIFGGGFGRLDGGTIPAMGPGDASANGDSPAVGSAVRKTVEVGRSKRSYLLYVPSSVAGSSAPLPFVSIHHGFTMSGELVEDLTTWKAIAERERFVVAFPEGGGPLPWNVGEHVCNVGAFVSAPNKQDDFAFVEAMVRETSKEQPIDASRVFVGGFSMGGYFANHIGCQGRQIVRAVSAHSAGTYRGECPGEPVPVLILHGDADTLIPYPCGAEARDYWVERNGCQSETRAQPIKGGECTWNQGCPTGQEVGMCTLHGMDHGWAGAKYTGPWFALQYGGGEQYENAAETMWTFFKAYL